MQGLCRLGRTTQLVIYPYERYLAWYAKYVKGEKD